MKKKIISKEKFINIYKWQNNMKKSLIIYIIYINFTNNILSNVRKWKRKSYQKKSSFANVFIIVNPSAFLATSCCHITQMSGPILLLYPGDYIVRTALILNSLLLRVNSHGHIDTYRNRQYLLNPNTFGFAKYLPR